jgi:hypothetical protein
VHTPDGPVHTPDGPVNYSGAASIFLKVASSASISLVHRTLSGGAPDSPVRQTWVPLGFFNSLYLNPSLVFLLACCEPLAPVELID